jgi:hypothetical protein
MTKFKLAAFALVVTAFINTTGCNTQPNHPNQLNTFDGASYDSLTVAHAALASFRVEVTGKQQQYTSVFNQAAAAYTTAFQAYSLYRATPTNQSAVAVGIANLAVSIVSLENAFQSSLHVPADTVLNVRRKATKLRANAAGKITISDILTELEIAAAIAQNVPGAAPYAGLAAIIINATQQALAAQNSTSGQAINLSSIQPIPLI